MERFYLEEPSLERKDEIIEYLDEFVKYNSNINGTGSLDKIYDGYTFEEIAQEENCSKVAIKYSVDIALKKIYEKMKKLT